MKKKTFLFAFTLSTGVFQSGTILGQDGVELNATDDSEQESAPETKEEKPERIRVTGSRIQRIDIETASPVITFDKSDIEATGTTSLGDFFRQSAATSPIGNFSGGSGFVAMGTSTVNLFGLGGGRTLLLINGKRIPQLNTGGASGVNLDNIPVGIIEKVDILAGGASAVYGADAVGGVINVTTKKYLKGGETSIYYSFTEDGGGETTQIDSSYGLNVFEDTNLIFSVGYRKREELLLNPREDKLSLGVAPRDYTLYGAPQGTYSYRENRGKDDKGKNLYGNWTPSDNCPVDNRKATVPTNINDIYCAGKRADVRTSLIPEKEEYSLSLNINSDLKSDWNLSGFLNYNITKSESILGQTGQHYRNIANPYSGTALEITADKARELGLDVSNDAVSVEYNAGIPGAPERVSKSQTEVMGGTFSLSGSLGVQWDVDIGVSYFKGKSKIGGSNIGNTDKIYDLTAIANENQYIPFDPKRNDADYFSLLEDMSSTEESIYQSVDYFMSTDLFMLPGGVSSFGFGFAVAKESYEKIGDPKDQDLNRAGRPLYNGVYTQSGNADRGIQSIYAEMNLPLIEQINLETAIRFDDYSDVGSAFNYSLGSKFSLHKTIALRAKYATSFKAVPLNLVDVNGTGGFRSILDRLGCQRDIDNGEVCDIDSPSSSVASGDSGNKDLDPEKGFNYSAGIVLQPIENLEFIADYHWISLRDTYSQDSLQDIADGWYDENGATSGDAGRSGEWNGNFVTIDEDGIITSIDQVYRNLGRTDIRSLNAKLNYEHSFGSIKIRNTNDIVRSYSYKTQSNKNEAQREIVGYFGVPAWRLNNGLSFLYGDHVTAVTSTTTAGQGVDPDGLEETDTIYGAYIDKYTVYNMSHTWTHQWNGKLQVGINNLANSYGGFHRKTFNESASLDRDLYNYSGRTYFMKVSQNF